MDNALLIDHESGLARSVSEIPLVARISRGPSSSLSSASLSPPREPAAGDPSGGIGDNAALASAEPVGTGQSASLIPPTTEDVSKLDLAIMGCAISLLVAIALNIGALTLSWATHWKVMYGSLTVVSIVATITAFLTAWCPAIAWARRLSPSCARFSLISAAALFVVFISCKLARFGCVGGVAAAAVVVVIFTVVWVWSELRTVEAAAEAEQDASDAP